MKKLIKIVCFVFLFVALLNTNIAEYYVKPNELLIKIAMAKEAETEQTGEKLSQEDWKIELNEDTEKGSKEFDFIQKSLASSDLADNGYFLLIIGIILVVISVLGITFFSICLYKLCKRRKNCKPKKQKSKHRYGE